MADVYYKIDGNNCYFTNEQKTGYTLHTAGDTVTENKYVTIELYNNKFVLPENSSYLFSYASNTTFNDIDKWDTSEVTDMGRMFHHCHSLTSLDLSNFNVSNVTYMPEMFLYCQNLEYILAKPGTNWSAQAPNLINSNGMFSYCSKLIKYGGETDVRSANNTNSIGYFISDPWGICDVYVKENDTWNKVEVYY